MVSEKTQNIITTLRQSDLTKFDNLNLLFEICLNILPEDEQLALKTAKFVKHHASLTASNPKFFDLYNRALLFLAPFDFDSYLLYLEKDRDPKSRFYLPRRKQLIKLGLIQILQELETGSLETLSLSLPPGTGKTTLGEFFISWVIGRDPEKYNLFVSHSGDITRMFYDAINNITSSGEYLWNDIFTAVKKESENAKIEQINFGKFKPFKSIQCTPLNTGIAGHLIFLGLTKNTKLFSLTGRQVQRTPHITIGKLLLMLN
jgi:hypothetical protein